MKVGDEAWLEAAREVIEKECGEPVIAIGLLWAEGLEEALNEHAAQQVTRGVLYGSDFARHTNARMPTEGLSSHVLLGVTAQNVRAYEPKYRAGMTGAKAPKLARELRCWPRDQVSAEAGELRESNVLGHTIEGRPVALWDREAGVVHSLVLTPLALNDELLAALGATPA